MMLQDLLNSSSYQDNIKGLSQLLRKKTFSNSELLNMLHQDNRLVVGEFLLRYRHFNKQNLSLIHHFVLQNLYDEDKLFVSDLIEFATNYSWPLPLQKCYTFLKQCGGDDDYPQIAFLNHLLFFRTDVWDEKLEDLLNAIVDNNCCSIYAQLRACMLLYKFTRKKRYVSNVIAYCSIDDYCKVLLNNIINDILRFEDACFV